MGSKVSSASDSSLADSATSGIAGSVDALHRPHRQHHRHHGTSGGGRTRTRSFGGMSQRGAAAGPVVEGVDGLRELDRPRSRSVVTAGSVPIRVFSFGIQCPVCRKIVPPEDAQYHLVLCLTKPQIVYNDDVLAEDKGECVICLEDMCSGDAIARLPCLCIYHKRCIDDWFKVNRSCPEHPGE